MKKKNISIPSNLSNSLKLEETFFPSNSDRVGIAVFSEVNENQDILRIIQIVYNDDTSNFEFTQELAAFSFDNRDKLEDFIISLPALTGLEMLMLLNPLIHTEDEPSESQLTN